MADKFAANRLAAGRLLPPIVTVPGPTAMTGQGRCFDKTIRNIRQEQTYSRRTLDNEKQQIKVRYERLKKKASQIRSNLTPEQIAEIQKGMKRGVTQTTTEGSRAEKQNHSARLAVQRGKIISLDMTNGPAGLPGSTTPASSGVLPRPKSARVERSIVIPSAIAMGQKRVRRSATSAKKPDLKTTENTPSRKPTLQTQKTPLCSKKSTEDDNKIDDTTIRTWTPSRPIPIPHSTAPNVLSKLKEEEMKKDRSATFMCCTDTDSSCSSPSQDKLSKAEFLNRPRSISAFGRLQSTPANSPTKLPTVPEEVRKVYSPVPVRKLSTPCPPPRPKSSICAPSSSEIFSEHKFASGVQNHRFCRRASAVASLVVTRPNSRRKSTNAGSATVRSPVAAVEPLAAFSCHEPKLEDALSRSSSAKNTAMIRRISTTVSPFQVSRARKREELREARIDDNELLAIELEQRKEVLMKGLEDITGRPHEDGKDETAHTASSKPEDVSSSSPKPKVEKRVDFSNTEQDVTDEEDPNTSWRKEMMKIRYLRLPQDCDEVITSDMLTLATAQHKAGSKLRKLDSK